MKYLLPIILLLSLSHSKELKCSVDAVSKVESSKDSISNRIIDEFLISFNASCTNNVEYTQYSNEVLFNLVAKFPTQFTEVIIKNKSKYEIGTILENFANPIHDGVAFKKIYNNLKEIKTPDKLILRIMAAVLVGARNIEITEI